MSEILNDHLQQDRLTSFDEFVGIVLKNTHKK